MAPQQLLLIEDVDDLGRSGDLVNVKPGFARNFLLPQKKAVVADKFTLRMQEKLKAERSKQAAADKQEAETLAAKINGSEFTITVKVDPEGHLYGSVSVVDVVKVLLEQGYMIEKKNVVLPQHIKALGTYDIALKLKESVPAAIKFHVVSEV